MIVVDASSVSECLLGANEAEILATAGDLHAPQVCDLEIASAVSRWLRAGILSETRATELVADYVALPLRLYGHRPLLARCVSLRANFSAYDAAYVALAERLGAPFFTLDRRLARAVRRHVPAVELVG